MTESESGVRNSRPWSSLATAPEETAGWTNELSQLKLQIRQLNDQSVHGLAEYLMEHPEDLSVLLSAINTTQVNAAACELFDAGSPEQLIKHFWTLILPETLPALLRFIEAIAECREHVRYVLLSQTLNGRILRLEIESTIEYSPERVIESCRVQSVTRNTSMETRQDRLRLIRSLALEASAVGCWQWDIQDDRLICDETIQHLMGTGDSQNPISAFANLSRVHPDDLQRCEPFVTELKSGALQEFQLECRFLDMNNCWRWHQVRGRTFGYTAEGYPTSVIGTLHDIDDTRKPEQLLRLEREVLSMAETVSSFDESMTHLAKGLERIWPGVRCGVNVFDSATGRCRVAAAPSMPQDYVNAVNQYRIGNYPSACGTAVTSRKCCFINDIHTDARVSESSRLYDAWKVRSCWSLPAVIGNGEAVATLCLMFERPCIPRPSEQAALERVGQTISLIIRNDMSEKQRRLLESRIQFREKLESLGTLAGGIAHDFNNLLTVIIGHAELLRNSRHGDSEVIFGASRILDASRLAADLCKQMVTFAGQSENVFEPVDLPRVVSEVCNLLRTSLPQGITLHTSIPGNACLVRGDRSMLSQVIINLITNASESIRGRSGQIQVTLSTFVISSFDRPELYDSAILADGHHACIEVVDTGKGMSVEEQRRLFEPFFTTKDTGKGLGLATVMGIVRRHHGGTAVTSAEGRGSQFRVYIPMIQAPVEQNPVRSGTPTEPQIPELAPKPGKSRVLLVDDDDSVRNSIAMMLRYDGHPVETFARGSDLILFVPQVNPDDILILDHQMPGIKGAELLLQLRQTGINNSVCFLSGYTGELRKQVDVSDSVQILEKPVSFSTLRQTVAELNRCRA
ncbi:MAG: response regulator [Planctomyces sp.]|nr:response regulator [Planctomyces sp.]